MGFVCSVMGLGFYSLIGGELVLALCWGSNGRPGTLSPFFQAACPGPGLLSLQSSCFGLC